ncbi:hypothetical protein [Woodsholea maritima]|uniref:hypothetical protein n=1 Tax=Woodsholea maritima TaxID=240237 RepID=UPI0003681C74|nr:hypothetical protein [Woodsholea maritima]
MKSKNETDLADYQDELAERSTGKIRRFFVDGEHTPGSKAQREKEASNSVTLTALQLAMQDPAYAAAYQAVWDTYERVQNALDEAILDNAEELERLEAEAARLDDGTVIFMRPDGSAETRDGRIIPPSALIGVAIPEDATTIEEYRIAMQRSAELADIQTEIIDPARDRINDQDNPLSVEELQNFSDEINRVAAHISGSSEFSISQNRSSDDPLLPLGEPQLSSGPSP